MRGGGKVEYLLYPVIYCSEFSAPPADRVIITPGTIRPNEAARRTTQTNRELRARPLIIAMLLVALALARESRAQDAFADNDFVIDVFSGPFFGAVRSLGLGGAYSALAAGVDGAPHNPAAFSAREPWDTDWFELDLELTLSFAGVSSIADLSERLGGLFRYAGILFASTGMGVQLGELGLGFFGQGHTYSIDGAQPVDASIAVISWGGGYGLFQNQLVLGVGGRTVSFSLTDASGERLLSLRGTGVDVGGLLKPDGRPWRAGVAWRSPLRSEEVFVDQADLDMDGVRRADGLVLPRAVELPWELELGFAYQFGPRPLNRRWINPWRLATERRQQLRQQQLRRQRTRWLAERAIFGLDLSEARRAHPRPADPSWWIGEAALRGREEADLELGVEVMLAAEEEAVEAASRMYVLVSASVVVIGPVHDGVGLQSFVNQLPGAPSDSVSVSPHLGVELEPWRGRLKTRFGTYLEPARSAGNTARMHVTGGLELLLFTWDYFGLFDPTHFALGAAVDWGRDYFDWGLSLTSWH